MNGRFKRRIRVALTIVTLLLGSYVIPIVVSAQAPAPPAPGGTTLTTPSADYPAPGPRFRDPTTPSPEVRKAIEAEQFVPKPGTSSPAPVIPQVKLLARLIGAMGPPTAVLDVNGQMYTVRADSEVTLGSQSAGPATLIVRELSKTGVLVELLPFKQTLMLN